MRTITLLLLLSSLALADESGTARVERGDVAASVTTTGRVLPSGGTPMIYSPFEWRGRLLVREILPPGTIVHEGQTVLRFDPREIDDALADARFEEEQARKGLELLRERQRIEAEAADRDVARKELELLSATKRYLGFVEHERPQSARRAELDRKSSEVSVRNAREELDQLLKMYEEDELVDDTEEIVLERARWNLEYRETLLRLQARQRDFDVAYGERDRERWLRFDAEDKQVALDRARAALTEGAGRREAALERAERDLALRERRRSRLERDRADMVFEAPEAGILLHGRPGDDPARRIRFGEDRPAHQPAVYVVDPETLVAVLDVPLKERLRMIAGQTAEITPDAADAGPIAASVVSVAPLPEGGHVKVVCRPATPLSADLLGSGCRGKIVYEVSRGVLHLPAAAVRADGDRRYVVLAAGGEERDVTTGLTGGGRIVVTGGLAVGDEVALPGEEKKE